MALRILLCVVWSVALSASIRAQTAITYIYDELGRLVGVVDPAGDTAIYTYDAAGNILSIKLQNSNQVSVIEHMPNKGPAGTPVTIYGTGFSATPSENTVRFNGVAAAVTSSAATRIETNVPAGATTGSITVNTPAGSGTSGSSFTVGSIAPTITGFTPAIGTAGTTVRVSGTNFETTVASDKATFNITRAATPTTATTTSLVAAVPEGATSGRISIATPNGEATSGEDMFIPPFPHGAADVAFTGRINVGSSRSVTINTPDKIALVVFDGAAGQEITLSMGSVTIPVSLVSVFDPDGTNLASTVTSAAGAALGPVTLPATGTYTIMIAPGRLITTVAGNGAAGYSGDGGSATQAHVGSYGVTVDGEGNLFLADTANQRVRKVATDGIITTVAGTGNPGYGGDGGPAVEAYLYLPHSVAVDGQGNLFIADRWNARVRKVDVNGIITTVVEDGIPWGIAVDRLGNLFIAEAEGGRIRKLSTDGTITTVAGDPNALYFGDGGPATSAWLNWPTAVAVDRQGNLFIADSENRRIRKVNTDGIIYTVAGNGSWGYSGDGGPATSARLTVVKALAVDGQGNLFLADSGVIREVSASGIITTVAGGGSGGDGGPANAASLINPWGVAVDGLGNLFIADSDDGRVRKVAVNTTTGSMNLNLTSR